MKGFGLFLRGNEGRGYSPILGVQKSRPTDGGIQKESKKEDSIDVEEAKRDNACALFFERHERTAKRRK